MKANQTREERDKTNVEEKHFHLSCAGRTLFVKGFLLLLPLLLAGAPTKSEEVLNFLIQFDFQFMGIGFGIGVGLCLFGGNFTFSD